MSTPHVTLQCHRGAPRARGVAACVCTSRCISCRCRSTSTPVGQNVADTSTPPVTLQCHRGAPRACGVVACVCTSRCISRRCRSTSTPPVTLQCHRGAPRACGVLACVCTSRCILSRCHSTATPAKTSQRRVVSSSRCASSRVRIVHSAFVAGRHTLRTLRTLPTLAPLLPTLACACHGYRPTRRLLPLPCSSRGATRRCDAAHPRTRPLPLQLQRSLLVC